MAPYVSLVAVKNELRITDASRNDRLDQLIEFASRHIDDRCGRRFWADTVATSRRWRTRGRVVRDDDGELLLVDDIVSETGLVVEVGGGTSWTAVAGYETELFEQINPDRPIVGLRRLYGSWSHSPRVRVTAMWGWPAIPAPVTQACLIMAARAHRDNPDSASAMSEWIPRAGQLSPGVKDLLAPYVLPGFA